jgi:hypothetical protein
MSRRHLPPDPERVNGRRSLWAALAVRRFQRATCTDDGDAVADLLCDLMHFPRPAKVRVQRRARAGTLALRRRDGTLSRCPGKNSGYPNAPIDQDQPPHHFSKESIMTEDFNLIFARREANVRKASAINKTAVFDALAAANITTVTAEFDGGGDSGGITSIGAVKDDENVGFPALKVPYQAADWNTEELQATEHSLEEAVEYLCYQLLEQTHGGWENNEGGYGTFVFTVAERRIELDFNGRFCDVYSHAHEF